MLTIQKYVLETYIQWHLTEYHVIHQALTVRFAYVSIRLDTTLSRE